MSLDNSKTLKRKDKKCWLNSLSGKDIFGLTLGSGWRGRDSVGAVGFPVRIGVNGFGLTGELRRELWSSMALRWKI